MIFKKSGPPEWLLVCLGNYGKQYENTRHNIGFMAAERLIDKRDLRCNRLRFRALTEVIEFGGANVLLMMPQTYMNLSGEAVGEAARFYKIPADHVIVISDDISLPLGKLRVRGSGSAGGHNGLKNIIAHLQNSASTLYYYAQTYPSSKPMGSSDPIYAGDYALWARLAN